MTDIEIVKLIGVLRSKVVDMCNNPEKVADPNICRRFNDYAYGQEIAYRKMDYLLRELENKIKQS